MKISDLLGARKNQTSRNLMVLVGLCVASIPLCALTVCYLPQVIDGATAGGSLRSTIVLTNPSASSATVKMALTRDDGSPLTVNFPDLSSGSQFSVTLKPNGTRILQTDGSGDGSSSSDGSPDAGSGATIPAVPAPPPVPPAATGDGGGD